MSPNVGLFYGLCPPWTSPLSSEPEASATVVMSDERKRAAAKAVAENARVVRVLFTLGEIALVGVVREQGDGGDAPEGSVAGQGTTVKISESIIAAVQILLAPDLMKDDGISPRYDAGADALPVRLRIPTPIRAHAFVALGKLCLRDRNLTKEFIPLFARELQNRSTPDSIRNNILIIFGDLCTRFTSQLSQYVPNMAACLQDPEPVIRRHSTTSGATIAPRLHSSSPRRVL